MAKKTIKLELTLVSTALFCFNLTIGAMLLRKSCRSDQDVLSIVRRTERAGQIQKLIHLFSQVDGFSADTKSVSMSFKHQGKRFTLFEDGDLRKIACRERGRFNVSILQ